MLLTPSVSANLSKQYPGLVLPRFSTPRTPDRPTLGGAVARAAKSLGLTLMPHQRMISDVAGEVLPSGRMAYPVVVLLLPRRGGKTKLLLPTFLQRASWLPGARCWYTAQTGSDAGLTFRQEWLPELAGLSESGHVGVRLSNGSEAFTVKRSGGRTGVFAPTRKALHGQDADVVGVDELWAFTSLDGRALTQAIRPAQLTRPQRQLWLISAGGDSSSEWLLEWRELGRALTGPDQGVAFFEWHPPVTPVLGGTGYQLSDGVDLDSPQLWAETHPAVGHTVDVEALAEDRATFGADEFHRAYLNVFQTGLEDRVLPRLAWERNTLREAAADPSSWALTLAYDVAPESGSASVLLASPGAGHLSGRVAAELIDAGPGSGWVADRVEQLVSQYRCRVVADSKGASTVVTAELRRRGLVVDECSPGQVAAAADSLLAALLNDRLAVRPEPRLDAAAGAAAKRQLGDGWAFTRRGSTSDITPVVALSLALAAVSAASSDTPLIQGA